MRRKTVYRAIEGIDREQLEQFQAGMRKDDAADFRELLARSGLQRIFSGVKQHVRHIDDKAARAVTSLEDEIQLR